MGYLLGNVEGRASLVKDGRYFDLERITRARFTHDFGEALQRFEELHGLYDELSSREPDGDIATANLLAPCGPLTNVFAIGKNYADHAQEFGDTGPPPEVPLVFSKFPGCITGPRSQVRLGAPKVDYEAEMVVVIGREGHGIEKHNAWDHVSGITAGQDLSDRELQFAMKPPHFDLGKSRDGFGPIGPLLASPRNYPDPNNIELSCLVNGELRQNAQSSAMIHSVPAIIEYISSCLTLRPGDIIFTGTPAGVGLATGRFLKPDDQVVTVLEGVGELHVSCV